MKVSEIPWIGYEWASHVVCGCRYDEDGFCWESGILATARNETAANTYASVLREAGYSEVTIEPNPYREQAI